MDNPEHVQWMQLKFNVHFFADGGLLLGASSLSYRYWVGSLWYFADASQAPNVEKCNAGVELECGINDAEWIDNARVFAASDTGK